MDDNSLLRLQKEVDKVMEIENVFCRLKTSEALDQLRQLFNKIFNEEHKFTIHQLLNLAKNSNKELNTNDITQQYKLNSHIFKQNLKIIVTMIIEDIWLEFNKLMKIQSQQIEQSRKQLFLIEEESLQDNIPSEPDLIVSPPQKAVLDQVFASLDSPQRPQGNIQKSPTRLHQYSLSSKDLSPKQNLFNDACSSSRSNQSKKGLDSAKSANQQLQSYKQRVHSYNFMNTLKNQETNKKKKQQSRENQSLPLHKSASFQYSDTNSMTKLKQLDVDLSSQIKLQQKDASLKGLIHKMIGTMNNQN